ncbi:hypothetical protein J2X12_003950 [Pseudarthrobacter oxydans]|jgi:hypothetical protein|uniref:Uncharacterized protein n=1 Tax=Pseudarthrobacter oxydans TaxID=1671 RepID=A0AAW8NG84_PSEOX|nr:MULTISPECIES: hypothetical protein [Micrococcaceae]MDR7165896.1 hypothetical protein [Pseudarthrobacter oxydans]VII98577.1 hypothetical protein [Arthrobacter sp. DR-2P]
MPQEKPRGLETEPSEKPVLHPEDSTGALDAANSRYNSNYNPDYWPKR